MHWLQLAVPPAGSVFAELLATSWLACWTLEAVDTEVDSARAPAAEEREGSQLLAVKRDPRKLHAVSSMCAGISGLRGRREHEPVAPGEKVAGRGAGRGVGG